MFPGFGFERRCQPAVGLLELLLFLVLFVTGAEARISAGRSVMQDPETVGAIEQDLMRLSGFADLEFEEAGGLRIGELVAAHSGSAIFREFLLNVSEDAKNWFVIENRSGSALIRFARTGVGTMDLDTGITRFVVEIDLEDLKNCRSFSDEQALSAFSIGLILFHEIDHKVSYDPVDPIPSTGVRPDVSDGVSRGVISRTNLIRNELDLAVREEGRHDGEIYKGPVDAFRRTASINFIDERGKRRVIRWKLE